MFWLGASLVQKKLSSSHYIPSSDPPYPLGLPFLSHPLLLGSSPLSPLAWLPHPLPHIGHPGQEALGLCPETDSTEHPPDLSHHLCLSPLPPPCQAHVVHLGLCNDLHQAVQVFRPLPKGPNHQP